jgi:hypothetical protein
MRWPADLKAKCPFYGFYKKTPEIY